MLHMARTRKVRLLRSFYCGSGDCLCSRSDHSKVQDEGLLIDLFMYEIAESTFESEECSHLFVNSFSSGQLQVNPFLWSSLW